MGSCSSSTPQASGGPQSSALSPRNISIAKQKVVDHGFKRAEPMAVQALPTHASQVNAASHKHTPIDPQTHLPGNDAIASPATHDTQQPIKHATTTPAVTVPPLNTSALQASTDITNDLNIHDPLPAPHDHDNDYDGHDNDSYLHNDYHGEYAASDLNHGSIGTKHFYQTNLQESYGFDLAKFRSVNTDNTHTNRDGNNMAEHGEPDDKLGNPTHTMASRRQSGYSRFSACSNDLGVPGNNDFDSKIESFDPNNSADIESSISISKSPMASINQYQYQNQYPNDIDNQIQKQNCNIDHNYDFVHDMGLNTKKLNDTSNSKISFATFGETAMMPNQIQEQRETRHQTAQPGYTGYSGMDIGTNRKFQSRMSMHSVIDDDDENLMNEILSLDL